MGTEDVKDKPVGDLKQMTDRDRLKQIIEAVPEIEKSEPTVAAIIYGLQFLAEAHRESFSTLGAKKMLQDVAGFSGSAPNQIRQQGISLVRTIKNGAGGAVGMMMREAIIIQEKKLDREISAEEVAKLIEELGKACGLFEKKL